MHRMAKTKISTLNLRINPAIKEAVREAAAMEHRSVANMVEVLIRRHCDHEGITIPEQSDLFPRNEHKSQNLRQIVCWNAEKEALIALTFCRECRILNPQLGACGG